MQSPFIFAVLIVVSITAPYGALAQTADAGCHDRQAVCAYQKPLAQLAAVAAESDPAKKSSQTIDDRIKELLDPTKAPDEFVLALSVGSAFANSVIAWEQARVDQQVGSSTNGSGTTDLVSRPSTPELLGLAMQAGALTQTVSGSTATFTANLYGSYQAIIGKPVVCLSCSDTVWKNINLSASFDMSGQTSKQLATSGSATSSTPAPAMVVLPQSTRQFSSFTASYNIYNPLDPRSKQFQQGWSSAYKNHQADLISEAKTLDQTLIPLLNAFVQDKDGKLAALWNTYRPILTKDAAKTDAVERSASINSDFEKYFGELTTLARAEIPDLDQKVARAAAAYAAYSQINYQAVQEARGKPQFTAQYTYNHPQSQPDTHDFKLIVGLNPKSVSGALFTLNFIGSIYGGQIPSGANYGRIRDFQFAAQFDRPLGDPINHPTTLTVAAYVQCQFDPSVLNIGPGNLAPGTNITLPQNAQVLLGSKGLQAIVQGKITINLKSGLNIPIAVSWANKTNLLSATDVRGNIGLTYNFDSISQLLGK
jgi:hypothetical protein